MQAAIADGMHYRYTYDVMGRLKEKQASGRTLLSLSYDLNGNLTRQEDVTGKVTEYVYNGLDQVSEVWDSGKLLAAYTYYPDGRMKSLKNGDSLYTRYTYDADKNLTHQKTMLGNELLVDNHYCYDGNGNRTEKRQLQGVTRYAYDALNRLKRVEYPTFTEKLFYDRAGNRVKKVVEEAAVWEETYFYDSQNRLTERRGKGGTEYYTYDEAGNLLRDGRAGYTYDAFGRCERIETFHGAVQINRYDAQGLRAEIEENGRLVQFIYRDREVVVEERTEEKVRYIRTGELLASDAQNAKTWYHYASDELGSITHVEAEGELLNRYDYDAWGNLTTCEEQVENRFKFTGQQLDPVSQQYYLRARYYNPVIGRFTQEDTYYEDGLNLYAYCRNNPVNYVDPSGNICEAAAQRIMSDLNNGKSKKGECNQLAAYLRNKLDRGETLNHQEMKAVDQLGIEIKQGQNSQLQNIADNAAQNYNAKYNPIGRAINKGYFGVTMTANGGISFQGTEYMHSVGGIETRITIEATGNRNNDFDVANAYFNFNDTPDGYVWHHVDDYNVAENTFSLELVRKEAHNAANPHSGGCAQYDTIFGSNYNRGK